MPIAVWSTLQIIKYIGQIILQELPTDYQQII